MVRCDAEEVTPSSNPRESIAYAYQTHHPFVRRPCRRLLHHLRHLQRGHVAEFSGQRLTKAEADQRYENSAMTYLFGLGDGSIVIDGRSMAMFIDRSCKPSREAEEIRGAFGSRPFAISQREGLPTTLPLRRRRRRSRSLQLRRQQMPRHDVFQRGNEQALGREKTPRIDLILTRPLSGFPPTCPLTRRRYNRL